MLLFSLFFLAVAVIVFSFQFYSYLDSQADKTSHTAVENEPSLHGHVPA